MKKNVYERKKINFEIQKNEIWLDLGANIGTFSLFCLSKNAKVIAFEPEPKNFEILEKNIKFNHFEKNIKIFQQAVSLNNGYLPLYLCKGDYNKYRHTLCFKRGREFINVKTVSIFDI